MVKVLTLGAAAVANNPVEDIRHMQVLEAIACMHSWMVLRPVVQERRGGWDPRTRGRARGLSLLV